MKDRYNRVIDYARISLTDMCNLHCQYCRSEDYDDCSKLSSNNVKHIIDVLAKLNFRKIRFTGGEPLLDSDIVDLVEYACIKNEIKDIGITTNGILLDIYIDDLIKAGLKRINISLDTLDRDTYKEITKLDVFDRVFNNIIKAREKGLLVKVNCVLLKGVNDHQIDEFLEFSKKYDIEIRFIELMPMGSNNAYATDKYISGSDLFKGYTKVPKKCGCKDVADYYLGDNGIRFGLISPMSNHFCSTCNRLRFTSEKTMRMCLHSNNEIDLSGVIDDENKLLETIEAAIFDKPEKHHLQENELSNKDMSKIGG